MIARASFVLLALACLLVLPRAAHASASVDLEVEPLNPQVGEPIRVRYGISVRNEAQVQVQPLQTGSLEPLSDMTPPELPMMWGGGFAMSIDTTREYILRANAPGQYTISNARVVNAATGRVIAQHPDIVIVVGGAGAVSTPATPQNPGAPQTGFAQPPPADPDAPPDGDLTGAEYNPNAFLRVGVDVANPYLGQQVTLRIWLYVASNQAGCELTQEPSLNGFWNELLTPLTRECATRWFTRNVAGRYMAVGLIRKIALFPTQTGRLTIGSTTAHVEALTGDFFRGVARYDARSPELQLDVRDAPSAGRPADYVPGTIGPVNLQAQADRTSVPAGETITIHVTATSSGSLASAQIVPPTNIDGVHIRSGGPTASHDLSSGHVVSTLETDLLVAPERAGDFDLGQVRLPYWDPDAQHYGVAQATLPQIHASGAAVAPEATTRAQDPEIELRPLTPSPSLRPYHPVFRRGIAPIAAIAAAPIAFALAGLGAGLRRRIARWRTRSAERARNDPRAILNAAQSQLASDPGRALSSAMRALDRAVAAADARAGDAGLPEPLRETLRRVRSIAEAARFGGVSSDAATVVNEIERLVGELEAVS